MTFIFLDKIRKIAGSALMAGVALFACTMSAQGALTEKFYARQSVLASGTWVKIGVDRTGVYEISYEVLREMGFSDPSKVSLYGRGGRVLPESFVTNAGVPVLTDDLTAAKVMHADGKLYFYGLGPEEIAFETDDSYSTGGYFRRKGNNIYTRRGYYFLTDSQPVAAMAEKNYDTSAAKSLEEGLGFIYHELDSAQNTTRSGQLFWGEAVGHPGLQKRTWDVTMPDAIKGDGLMHCEVYLSDNQANYGKDATLAYGFENTQGYFSKTFTDTGALYYTPQEPAVTEIEVPGQKGKVFLEFKANEMGDCSNLDFWVVSYRCSLPTLTDPDGNRLNQRLLALPAIEKNSTGKLELSNSASYEVWDVTSPADPQRLAMTVKGPSGVVGVRNTNKTPVIVVFDKERPQMQICGYEKSYSKIANQNLHSYKDEGADFIIITTPAFRAYAEELAQLHRDYDGMKVVVATTEECYNEFSGGTPDPMAYRSFAKMLYMSPCQPKNMLLLGPLYADFRGLQEEHDPMEGIIAYQSPSISVSRGAHNINDFYGMMDDKFRTDYYERNEVHIGVGILPVKFENEARIVVNKVRNFLERDDHAYYLNRYTAIGGIGEAHTHETQIRDINNHIRTLENTGTMLTSIPIDTYGKKESHKKFVNQLNEGCGMFSYFGHGAEMFMGKDPDFFNAGDVYKLRNKITPLALFGGCQITNSDRGYRGLGETLVTNTEFGAIGSIVSARDTWSGQNYEFFKQFFICLYKQGSTALTAHRVDPVTIGEVYASVKNYSTYNNELAYQLLCDPALIIPAINRNITVSADMPGGAVLLPGDTFKMKGRVLKADKSTDDTFNGQVVVRVAEPEKKVPAGNIETGEAAGDLAFTFRDRQVAMAVADVRNGEFTAEVHIPSSFGIFKDQKSLFYFTAYDPSTKVGAGVCLTVPVGAASANPAEAADDKAPVIEEFTFDETDSSISFTVSDDLALNMAQDPLIKGLYLYIDGRERSEAHFAEPVIESSRHAYSKNVFIDGLTYGEHVARLKVKDVAGNASEKEILFTYNPARALYSISRSEESSASFTRISIDGVAPARCALVVLSAEGTEVWRGEFSGNEIDWNHEFTAGGKVPAGHYKAFIIETGSGNLKGHSETIDIPVI